MGNLRMNEKKVVTGLVRFCYPHLFDKKSLRDGEEGKYRLQILIPKGDEQTLKKIRKRVLECEEKGVELWGEEFMENLKLPLRDGDVERGDDENYENQYFLNSSSKVLPEVVDERFNELSEEQVYPGCYGRVSLLFFPFNKWGKRGVGCTLLNVQKLQEGEELPSRTSAMEDFTFDEEEILG